MLSALLSIEDLPVQIIERWKTGVFDDLDVNCVLECAIVAGANCIVSGDDHLLDLEEYQGIEVLPPAGIIILLNM